MELRLLGPVEVRAGGRRLDTGPARQRAVLAVLMLDLGRVVPAERLIDRVWGERPPGSVRSSLYGYVARLRAALAAGPDQDVVLARRPEGYLLEADPDRLDLHRFRGLAGAAANAGDERAAALLREALGLWHGPALAGLSSPWLDGIRATLEQQRVAALLDLGDIALRQGRVGELTGTLAGEAAAGPVNERLIGQLMLALYRSGRQAEALRWFEQARRRLADELGVDPDAGLRALHQRILRADPALDDAGATTTTTAGNRTAPAAAPATASPDGPRLAVGPGQPGPHQTRPRELPADVPGFTGRTAELGELDRLLTVAAGHEIPAAVVISAVSGTAGVGKTALAVRWAHQVAPHFPDGQLYVNLRGYDPDQPMPAADALAGFLRALGVAAPDIPAEAAERAARYRSLLAGRRMLVVLDNARSADQVRPLLPGTPACPVVVTSRDSLAGLVARDGARRLDLDLLPLEEAVGLLAALIGDRVGDDPGAARRLAVQCARLPLALRIAAELAVARPTATLAQLTAELADQRGRLDRLDAGGDTRTAVRAVFSWSGRHLDAATARMFRLAGLHPGPDLDRFAAAALADSTPEQAGRLLDALARAHLAQLAGPGRYAQHDLLRSYARELAAGQDGEAGQRAALDRLFGYYLEAAGAAMDTLYPAERHHRPDAPPAGAGLPALADPVAARDWLDAERASLVAAAGSMAQQGWPGSATRLASVLFRYLDGGGHFAEAAAVHSHARAAARHAGDVAAEVGALNSLGVLDAQQGRYAQAAAHFEQALALGQDTGDRGRQARTLGNLGLVELQQGRYADAAARFADSLAIYCEAGDRTGQTRSLANLGDLGVRQGRYEQAREHLEQALALSRELSDRAGEAHALANLGRADLGQGRCDQAREHLRESLEISRALGNPPSEAYALAILGEVELRQGHGEQAAGHHRRVLELFAGIGDRAGEAMGHNGLGEVWLTRGDAGLARAEHATALSLAGQIGDLEQQARAYRGLAWACDQAGDRVLARQHWQEALRLYAGLGAPETAEIEAALAGPAPQRG